MLYEFYLIKKMQKKFFPVDFSSTPEIRQS